MDFRVMGLDAPMLSALHHLMEDVSGSDSSLEKEKATGPTRSYVRDATAMAYTPLDIKELPESYVFLVDMPGVKSGEIRVQVEDDNLLVITGERKREDDRDQHHKYLRMERRMGKFMRKFSLPENVDTENGISAICQDGVLTVTVQKKPPPEPKKPKTIEVKIA